MVNQTTSYKLLVVTPVPPLRNNIGNSKDTTSVRVAPVKTMVVLQ